MIGWLRRGFRRNTWWSRLLYAGLYPVVGVLYMIINKAAVNFDRHYVWKWAIDDWIPFNKYFVIAYYYWYVQIVVSIAWLVFSRRTGRLLHRMVLAINLSMIISSLFFLFLPTTIDRPAIIGDGPLELLLRQLFAVDNPYNLFPSIHVAYSVVMARYWTLAGPRRLWFHLVNYGGTVMVLLSTVFIKQHYAPDIFGGIAVAVIACLLSDLLFRVCLYRLLPETVGTGSQPAPTQPANP